MSIEWIYTFVYLAWLAGAAEHPGRHGRGPLAVGQRPRQPDDDLQNPGQAELGRKSDRLAAEQAEDLLRAVDSKQQSDHHPHQGVQLRTKTPKHTFHHFLPNRE